MREGRGCKTKKTEYKIICCDTVCRNEPLRQLVQRQEGLNVMDVRSEKTPLLWSTASYTTKSAGQRFLCQP